MSTSQPQLSIRTSFSWCLVVTMVENGQKFSEKAKKRYAWLTYFLGRKRLRMVVLQSFGYVIRLVQELSGEWPRFGYERIQPGASVEEAIISPFPSILMVVQACGPATRVRVEHDVASGLAGHP